MNVDDWNFFRRAPGWIRDRMVAANYYQIPNHQAELSEYIAEASIFMDEKIQVCTDFVLAMLVRCYAQRDSELHLDDHIVKRSGHHGELTLIDEFALRDHVGIGPFHRVTIRFQRDEFLRRVTSIADGKPFPAESLIRSSFFDVKLQRLIHRLIDTRRSQLPCDPFTIDALMDQIYVRLLSVSGSQIKNLEVTDRLKRRSLKDAIDYIHANFGQKITRDQLADLTGVAPHHFSRLFHQTVGITPKRYLLNIRIKQVKALLDRPCLEHPLEEIATQCGFTSKVQMSVEFKRQLGITPLTYLDKYRGF